MVDILEEAKSSLAQEQFQARVKKLAKPIGIVAVLAVVATGGVSWYQQHTRAEAEKMGLVFLQAQKKEEVLYRPDELPQNGQAFTLSDERLKTGLAAYDTLMQDAHYSLLAAWYRAGLYMDAQKPKEAMELYGHIRNHQYADAAQKDLALLIQLAQQVGSAKIASDAEHAFLEQLEPLTAAERPFALLAQEILALHHLRQQQVPKAKTVLQAIIRSPQAPVGLVGRANHVLSTLGK
jgi:hypothetical protein